MPADPAPLVRQAFPRAQIALPMLAPGVPRAAIALGSPALDAALGGGLARGALHEVYAANEADVASATGFAAALARSAAGARPILWVRQDALDGLTGRLYAPGLAEIGIDPNQVLLVRAPDVQALLRAGAEGSRCAALGAVLIEPWGQSKLIDLTASRRLHLAARASGTPVLLLRVSAAPAPSAAATRWQIAAAPSHALSGDAPGLPAFAATLLRQRGGAGGTDWTLEWNRDHVRFDQRATPLSGGLVPVSLDRSADIDRRAA